MNRIETNMNRVWQGAVLLVLLVMMNACSPAEGDETGHEFMPDMYHSIAYEANYYDYYWFNTWGTKEDYRQFVGPREPVKGTIARGAVGVYYAQQKHMGIDSVQNVLTGQHRKDAMSIPANGAVPYYYEDTEEERTRASNEIIDNPYPITENGLVRGEELYNIYCGICHGPAGGGNGYIVRDDGGKYPAQPTSFLTDELINASNGRYYHAIMYGRNVMGAYKDKLSYEERWQVIHYIRSLQASEKGLVYTAQANTLNETAVPEAQAPQMAESQVETDAEAQSEESHNE